MPVLNPTDDLSNVLNPQYPNSGAGCGSPPTDSLVLNVTGKQLAIDAENSAFYGGRAAFNNVGAALSSATLDPYGGSEDSILLTRASGHYFELGTPAFGHGPFTIQFWLRLATVGLATQHLFAEVGAGIPSWPKGIWSSIGGTNLTTFTLINEWLADTGTTAVISTTGFSVDTWHHVACTANPDLGRMSIYIDGTREAVGAPPARSSAITYLAFGRHFLAGSTLDGRLADIRIHNEEIGTGDPTITVPTGYLP